MTKEKSVGTTKEKTLALVKRGPIKGARKYSKEFLLGLINVFSVAGFDLVTIKLPHNLITDNKDELGVVDFIQRGRNYPSVILQAENSKTKELVKILFVNISTKAFFKDNTFPSGHSEPPEIYVQSSDPVRLLGLYSYFKNYIEGDVTAEAFRALAYLSSFIFILVEVFSYVQKQAGAFSVAGKAAYWDYVLIGVALFCFFKFFSFEKGLYIKSHDQRYLTAIKRAVSGDFKDNPLVNFAVTVIGGLVVAFLAKLLGWI